VKLSVTQYEREQLATAQQVVGELNANLAGRGAGFRFAVTLAGKGVMPADLDGILAAAGDEPCG
jgi:hypothetical protein